MWDVLPYPRLVLDGGTATDFILYRIITLDTSAVSLVLEGYCFGS